MQVVETDRTLIESLQRQLRQRPTALSYRSGQQSLSYLDLEAETNRIANALAKMGIGKDDRVACLTKHHLPCILLTLAACKIGAVCMPVNWRLAPAEAEYIIGHGQARLLMVDQSFSTPFVPGSGTVQLPAQCKVVCTEGPAGPLSGFKQWYAEARPEFTPVRAGPDDSALQLYSSGTTGLPKGVVLTHRGLLSTCRVVSEEWHFGCDGVFGNPLPTFHVAGMTMLLLTLYAGGTTLAYSDFDPGQFIESIQEHRITHTFLVPAMILFMLQSPAAKARDSSSLKLIAYGGSPIADSVLKQAMETFRCDFLQVYGLTEVSGPATFLSQEDHRRAMAGAPELLRSAGRPVGGGRMRIVDPVSGTDLPEGSTGEVWIETIRNLKEYWHDAEATRRAFPEGRNDNGGWLRTGDGGYAKDGYLFINDRIKDMIISGGENIYPAEVENVLMNHSAVLDAAIIGVPDPTWGEAVKACVVRRPGVSVTGQEIIDWMRERVAHFKCPKSIDFVDALPRNPSGKILKRVLREPFWKGQERAVH